MQHLTHTARIEQPIETCFRYVDTHENVPKWLYGVSEFRPIGQPERGLGTMVAISVKIGPVALRGRGTVCDYVENEIIAVRADLVSVTVVLVWMFRADSSGATEITADISYQTAPGMAGRAVAKLVERVAVPAMTSSERALRKQLLTETRS